MKDSHSARASSYDRTGGNVDFRALKSGETLNLATLAGAGCIRHIYFTIVPTDHYLRDLVLRMYWDGETAPSVEVPFGDFFGEGQERVRFFRSLMVTVNPGAGGVAGTVGFNAYFPMPFEKGARLTLTNEGEDFVGAVWYHVDYEKLRHVDKDAGRFHAQWHRENPTTAVGDIWGMITLAPNFKPFSRPTGSSACSRFSGSPCRFRPNGNWCSGLRTCSSRPTPN